MLIIHNLSFNLSKPTKIVERQFLIKLALLSASIWSMKSTNKLFFISLYFTFRVINGYSQILAPPIHYWDFSNGITPDWTLESSTPIADWEYRGPNTDPDITVCSRGSCGASSVPITSITSQNGFVIFDSNYWDDDDGICGGLGTGQDPAPHLASIITPSVNLSGVNTVVLTFQQQYKHYQTTTTKVYVSNNNGNSWTQVLANSGVFSANSEWKTVNITAQAAGFTNVKIKFEFSGTYYWWLLDDIALYSPNPNDLQLANPAYSEFGIVASPIIFDDMMYNAYPQSMIPSFKFTGQGTNIGGNSQTQVRLFVDVKKNGMATTYSSSSPASTLNGGQSTLFQLSTLYTTAPEVAEYFIYYNLDQLQIDDNAVNNLDTFNYFITPHTYSRDEYSLETVFTPQAIYAGQKIEVGNVFQARSSGLQFASIQAVLGEGTTLGSEVYGIVWNLDRTEILGQTNPYTVNLADINEIGGNKHITLPLQTPITLLNDSLYLVMIGMSAGPDLLRIGRSGIAPAEASLVRYPDSNGLFYMLTTPMVRMNIFPAGTIAGCTNTNAENYNPLATTSDSSCLLAGCTIEGSFNYDPTANWDNGSCIYCGCTNILAANYDAGASCDNGTCIIFGCTDSGADNYNSQANTEDNSCFYLGCTNPGASNYDSTATVDNGTCTYPGCTDTIANNFDPNANLDDGSCIYLGCMNVVADNYNPIANVDDGSCIVSGCTDPSADNYWIEANNDDGSCIYFGCTNPEADNYDPQANVDDGTCIFLGCTDPEANNYDLIANANDFSCLYNQAILATNDSEGCAPFILTIFNQTEILEEATCVVSIENVGTWINCEPIIEVELLEAGTYYVNYTYEQGDNISNFALGPIEVFENPLPPVLSAEGDGSIECMNCDEINTEWFLDGTIFSQSNDNIIDMPTNESGYVENGFYSINVIDENSCQAHSDSLLSILGNVFTENDTLCVPATVSWFNETDSIINGIATMNFGDDNVLSGFEITYNHTYNAAGDFNWLFNYELNDVSFQMEGSIHVVENPPTPILTIDEINGFLACSNAALADSITWDVNGTLYFNISVVSLEEGLTTVYLSNEDLCSSQNSINYTGLEIDSSDGTKVYPIPSRNLLYVENCLDSRVEIFSSSGQKVYSAFAMDNILSIDVSGMSSGIYGLIITRGNYRRLTSISIVR